MSIFSDRKLSVKQLARKKYLLAVCFPFGKAKLEPARHPRFKLVFQEKQRPTGRPAEFVIARLMMGSSKGELDDLLKDREAIRKVIAKIVERYLPESFWNKLEGSAMQNDPVMRRLIMRDMLGGE